jgi:hypothetical protein
MMIFFWISSVMTWPGSIEVGILSSLNATSRVNFDPLALALPHFLFVSRSLSVNSDTVDVDVV